MGALQNNLEIIRELNARQENQIGFLPPEVKSGRVHGDLFDQIQEPDFAYANEQADIG